MSNPCLNSPCTPLCVLIPGGYPCSCLDSTILVQSGEELSWDVTEERNNHELYQSIMKSLGTTANYWGFNFGLFHQMFCNWFIFLRVFKFCFSKQTSIILFYVLFDLIFLFFSIVSTHSLRKLRRLCFNYIDIIIIADCKMASSAQFSNVAGDSCTKNVSHFRFS